jgi:hypothetical protein
MTAFEKFRNRQGLKTDIILGAALAAVAAIYVVHPPKGNWGIVGDAVAAELHSQHVKHHATTPVHAQAKDATKAVMTMNSSNMDWTVAIAQRAEAQLADIDGIKRSLESSSAFLDPKVPDARKADVIQQSLRYVTASNPEIVIETADGRKLDPAAFDNNEFALAKSLPPTGAFKATIDSLNYKRSMVDQGIEALHDVQAAFFTRDREKIKDSIDKLDGLMADYELAQQVAKEDGKSANPGGLPDPKVWQGEPDDGDHADEDGNQQKGDLDNPGAQEDDSDHTAWDPTKRTDIAAPMRSLRNQAERIEAASKFSI